jgi:hypothetical protein
MAITTMVNAREMRFAVIRLAGPALTGAKWRNRVCAGAMSACLLPPVT